MTKYNDPTGSKIFDPSTIFGILIAFVLVGTAIYLGGNVRGFIDVPSILIVFFGTMAITAACFSLTEYFNALKNSVNVFFYYEGSVTKAADISITLSKIARKDGTLALEKASNLYSDNSFLNSAITMLVDNLSMDEAIYLLEAKLQTIVERHNKNISVFRKAAEIAPAMGLLGTLIGLVQMLGNLNDPATIGPAMAVALLTTFYGVVLCYMLFIPIASKLERNTIDEVITLRIYLETIKSIYKKENPRELERTINSFLPPVKQVEYFEKYGVKESEVVTKEA